MKIFNINSLVLNAKIHSVSDLTCNKYLNTINSLADGETYYFYTCTANEANIQIGLTNYKVNSNHFFITNSKHLLYWDNFASLFCITFSCDSRHINLIKEKNIMCSPLQKQLLSLIVKNSKSVSASNMSFGQIFNNSIQTAIILAIKSVLKTNEQKYINETDKLVGNIKNILAENVYGYINFEILKSKLFFSKTYLNNTFKDKVGISIIEYYNLLKIDEAKNLIAQKKHSITKISEMLHFNNVYYFSTKFKKMTGLTPTQYYNSLNENN